MFLTNPIERVPVSSSNLRAVGYDRWSLTLEIKFCSGGAYAYDGVPPRIHAGLMAASSKGGYLAAFIKGRYPYRRLNA